MFKYITLLILLCVVMKGFTKENEFLLNFEELNFPILLETMDNRIYDLFNENKEEIKCCDLKILNEPCNTESIFKYGFLISKSDLYYVIIYAEIVSNDTLFYKMATLNPKNELISSINVMEYNGDGESINSRILNQSEIFLLQREFMPVEKYDSNMIKVKEAEKRYRIDDAGKIKLISYTESQIRYYKFDKEGRFVYVH